MRRLNVNNLILFFSLIAISLIVVSAVFLYPMNLVDGSTGGFLSGLFRIGAALSIIIFSYYLSKKVNLKYKKIIFIAFLLLAFLTQLIFLLTFSRPVYTDTGYVTTMAARLIEGNHSWYQYFYVYPNNVNVTLWWSYLLTPFHWLGITHYQIVLPWIQMLMLDLGIFYLSRSLKILNQTLATIFRFTALYYTPWFMYAIFPYNDVVAIALIMGVIGCLIRLLNSESNKQKWVNGIVMMLLLGIAITIRQNSVIILMALLLTILFSKQFTFKFKSGLILLGVVFSLFGTLSFNHLQKSAGFESKPELVTPAVRYVNMSWNPHTAGQIDGPDSFLYSNFPKKERAKLITGELKHRIKKLGVLGILKHVVKKIAFMFSIGYSNEDMGGLQVKPPLLKNEWQAVPLLELIGNLFQPIYILLLLFAIYTTYYVLRHKKIVDTTTYNLTIFSAFSIVGIFTFHILLWEVRDRYALPMIPFLILLSAIGMQLLISSVRQNQGSQRIVMQWANKGVIVATILLVSSFAVSLNRSQQQVGRSGFVYYSGFSMYTENGNELQAIPAKSEVKTTSFNLQSPANILNIDFSKLSVKQLDNLNLMLTNLDNNKSWHINLKPNVSSYPGNYPVGRYQLKIENTGQKAIKSDALQNLGTTNLQGPDVSINGKTIKGLNAIFSFTEYHEAHTMNVWIYSGLHLIFILLAMTPFVLNKKKLKE